jgi:hypothetical protein
MSLGNDMIRRMCGWIRIQTIQYSIHSINQQDSFALTSSAFKIIPLLHNFIHKTITIRRCMSNECRVMNAEDISSLITALLFIWSEWVPTLGKRYHTIMTIPSIPLIPLIPWDMRYEIWDMRYEIWDMRYEILLLVMMIFQSLFQSTSHVTPIIEHDLESSHTTSHWLNHMIRDSP